MKYLKADANHYDVIKAVNRIITILYMVAVTFVVLAWRLYHEGVLVW